MDITYYGILNKLRAIYYDKFNPEHGHHHGKTGMTVLPEYGNKLVYEALTNEAPVMIARMGTTETGAVVNCIGVKDGDKNLKRYITYKSLPWFWKHGTKVSISTLSGFFPVTNNNLMKFGEMMLEDLSQVDILIKLCRDEESYEKYCPMAKRIDLTSVEPFFANNPWTKALKGKKILVIHPMVETFKKQWQKREKIFPNGMMPEFELLTIKAVQTVAYEKCEFKDWFEALEWMKNEISKVNFDICLIGCGAYGFPLAAHVKRLGKKAIHLGGSTQLLFGVKGKRWENDKTLPFKNMFNEHWTRPDESETPKNANIVEGGCYW